MIFFPGAVCVTPHRALWPPHPPSPDRLIETPACFIERAQHTSSSQQHTPSTTKLAVKLIPFTFFITSNVISFIPFSFSCQRRRCRPLSSLLSCSKAFCDIKTSWNFFFLLFPTRRQSNGECWPHRSLTLGPLQASVFSSIKLDKISRLMKKLKKPWDTRVFGSC